MLYAWHVLPLVTYTKFEAELLKEPLGLPPDVRETKAFEILTNQKNSESLLVINC